MSEEMRKEFEVFWVNYCTNRGVNCNLARLINGEYASWPEHNAYVGWQASREAMKPIKLPDATFETPSGDNALREDAVIGAIYAAGYKVAQ